MTCARTSIHAEDAPPQAGRFAGFHPLLQPRKPPRAHRNRALQVFSYAELMARDKASLDVFWLKDDSLDKLEDLPPPDVLQQEIIEHLEAALAAFRDVAAALPRGARA